MNNSFFIIKTGRVVQAPETRMAGDKSLTTIRVAVNTFGEKAKERYREAYFVDLTFSGRQGETAAGLAPGDQVGGQGILLLRDYTTKANEARTAFEIPYADGLVVHTRKAGPAETAETKSPSATTKPPGSGKAKPAAAEDDPFANL